MLAIDAISQIQMFLSEKNKQKTLVNFPEIFSHLFHLARERFNFKSASYLLSYFASEFLVEHICGILV